VYELSGYLNYYSSRSFEIFDKYPIFPKILNDYVSKKIEITNTHKFRDFDAFPIILPSSINNRDNTNSSNSKEKKVYDMSTLQCLVRVKPFSNFLDNSEQNFGDFYFS